MSTSIFTRGLSAVTVASFRLDVVFHLDDAEIEGRSLYCYRAREILFAERGEGDGIVAVLHGFIEVTVFVGDGHLVWRSVLGGVGALDDIGDVRLGQFGRCVDNLSADAGLSLSLRRR